MPKAASDQGKALSEAFGRISLNSTVREELATPQIEAGELDKFRVLTLPYSIAAATPLVGMQPRPPAGAYERPGGSGLI